jgi:hypothetical protein
MPGIGDTRSKAKLQEARDNPPPPPGANDPDKLPKVQQKQWGGFGGSDSTTYKDPINYTYNGLRGPLDPEARPGEMTIEVPPRPMHCDELARHRKKTHVAADEGSQLGNITRIITDQRVFTRKLKKRKGGGTVLFDLSGSMGGLAHCIDEVISTNKTATTCATYSGSRRTGVLRVIVKDGTRVVPDLMQPPGGGNNIVDIPALDWLSRQPAPRVWVSDQCVTGVTRDHGGGYYGNEKLLEAAHQICAAFNIAILDSPHEVADHLKQCWEGEKSTGANPNAYKDNE